MEELKPFFQRKHTLTCRGKVINIEVPLVMGIINITPDSFYSASRFNMKRRILRRAQQIVEQGGKIIDVGACSTRPGSAQVSTEEELKRLSKALSVIRKHFPNEIISVDTFRSAVAKRVVNDFDVNMINDISAGDMDPAMFETVAELRVPYIIMHMKGTPNNMQINPVYDNVVKEVFSFFTQKMDKLNSLGINDILIDPGFGFGKNTEHNFTLLKNLDAFKLLELPIVAGLSRKSMIYKNLDIKPEEAMNGTTTLNTIAVLKGANILRVHDVLEAVQTIKLLGIMQQQQLIV